MSAARYLLPQHPLKGPHTKEELLVERGSLSRGEIALDRQSNRSHRIGELLEGMRPPRAQESGGRLDRPAYQEFSGDTPWEEPAEDDDEFIDEDEDELADEDSDLEIDEGFDENGDPIIETTERICWHGHPSWFSFVKAMLIVVILLVGSIMSMEVSGTYLLVGLALTSLALCCTIISRQHRDYYVTTERVEAESGIIGRNSKEIRIVDIRSIDVHEQGLMGLLGIGTVDFSSSGTDGVEVQFKNVRRAHRVKELVRQLQKRASHS
jgi:membrane protein YdbS with pleckstrin-like domain